MSCVSGTFHDLVVYPDMILLPKWFLMVKNPRHSRCYFHKLQPCCETLQLKYRVFLFSQHRICRLPRTGFGRHWRWPRHAISREAQRLQLSRQHPGWVGGVNSVWCSHRYRFFIENAKRRWTFLSYALSIFSTYIIMYIHICIYTYIYIYIYIFLHTYIHIYLYK